MWVRKRIEITSGELLLSMANCIRWADRSLLERRIGEQFASDQSLVCLSIRSGFDLMLQSMNWPSGSQIIMSGLTIPDMSRIVRRNDLEPIGVDIDPDTLVRDINELESKITPKTRAIVIAHLFGGLIDLEPIIQIARQHNLLVVEDCAQAYVGNHYRGHADADVSMFSFGPIKTNTALGGGVFFIRRDDIRQQMYENQKQWPVQGRVSFFRRLIKYGFVKLVSTRMVAGAIGKFMRMIGSNHDGIATSMARGFAGPNFFHRIRKQPSIPLLLLLENKLKKFDRAFIQERCDRGNRFADRLRGRVDVLGTQTFQPTYWVLPVLVNDRQQLVEKLWRAGFDATTSSSLSPVPDDPVESKSNFAANVQTEITDLEYENLDDTLPTARYLLNNLVILPFDMKMPVEKLKLLADLILETEPTRPPRPVVEVHRPVTIPVSATNTGSTSGQ